MSKKYRRNDITITTHFSNRVAQNFKLYEFENKEGLVMVNPLLVRRLEKLRHELNLIFGRDTVKIIITNAIRTEADNERLAKKLGWTDEGGLVSRNSKHLTKYGGIAADIVAYCEKRKIAGPAVGKIAQKHFDFVKSDYEDGHVHVDLRETCK